MIFGKFVKHFNSSNVSAHYIGSILDVTVFCNINIGNASTLVDSSILNFKLV